MQNTRMYIGFAILLIAAGLVLLLQNFGILDDIPNLLWILLFAAGGLIFLWAYLANRQLWWPLIPGFALLGIAATIALSEVSGNWAGAAFLGFLGLGFWAIYLTHREYWWPIIPGGAVISVALVAGLSETVPGEALGGILFLGLAVTFAVLSLVSTPEGRMKWPLIPAIILAVMGIALIFSAGPLGAAIGAVVMIALGGYLILRGLALRRS